MRRWLPALVLAALLGPRVADAEGPAAISVSFSPSVPRSGTTLRIILDGTRLGQPNPDRKVPAGVRLALPAGSTFDANSVSLLCDRPSSCPAASKVGDGSAVLAVTVLGHTSDVTATLRGYLAPPKEAGDLAALVVEGEARGRKLTVTGRVLRDGVPELVFEDISGGTSLPSGVRARLKSLTLTMGAHRVDTLTKTKRVKRTIRGRTKMVKRTVRVEVHHNLVTTPPTCAGPWTAAGVVSYVDGTRESLQAPVDAVCPAQPARAA